jgi:hypothetical protein
MRVENYDPALACVLNRLNAPLDEARLSRMTLAVTAALDAPHIAFPLPRYFLPVSALGMVCAAVLGLWLGGAWGQDVTSAVSPTAFLIQLATGGASLS